MNIYTGYIYLWYDTKAKLFYLGGHKGKVEDSYICSNDMMLRAYKKRPESFKLRVLEYVYGDNKSLRNTEQKWLDKIQDKELYWTPNIYNKTVRYYNQKKRSAGGNGSVNKGKKLGGWNKGYTKEQIELRKQGLLCFIPLDIPKNKTHKKEKLVKTKRQKPVKVLRNKNCVVCSNRFDSYKENQKTCSRSCSAKIPWIKGTGIAGFKNGVSAWNKNKHNPNAANNGKKGRFKQSKTVTGRKISIDENGRRIWIYPKE